MYSKFRQLEMRGEVEGSSKPLGASLLLPAIGFAIDLHRDHISEGVQVVSVPVKELKRPSRRIVWLTEGAQVLLSCSSRWYRTTRISVESRAPADQSEQWNVGALQARTNLPKRWQAHSACKSAAKARERCA